jgi:hypothetical protein
VPLAINEYIARMAICKPQKKRPLTVLAIRKVMKGGAHDCQGSQLLPTVIFIVSGVWLITDSIVMTR